MGAGNFIAFSKNYHNYRVDLLTTNQTFSAVEHFFNAERTFIIDSTSWLKLIKSISVLFPLYFQGRYRLVVNMESESVFAKFIVATIPANSRSGISNVYRSFLDYLIYDNYVVSPNILPKNIVLNQLREYKPTVNNELNVVIRNRQLEFLKKYCNELLGVNKLVIAPTCSKADEMRRLPSKVWLEIFDLIDMKRIKDVQVLLPNKGDPQAEFFYKISSKYPSLRVVVKEYKDFVSAIEFGDLLITVDSQALHIAQYYGTLTFCFFGPSSPFGVSIADTTYPISASLECSPCTHKYFVKPCKNQSFCMDENFMKTQLDVFKKINTEV